MLAIAIINILLLFLYFFYERQKLNTNFSKKTLSIFLSVYFFMTFAFFIITPSLLRNDFNHMYNKYFVRFITERMPNLHANNFAFTLRFLLYSTFPIVLIGYKFKDNIMVKLANVFYVPLVAVISLIGLPILSYSFIGSSNALTNLNSFGLMVSLLLIGQLVLSFIIHLLDFIKTGLPKNVKVYLFALLGVILSVIVSTPNMTISMIFPPLKEPIKEMGLAAAFSRKSPEDTVGFMHIFIIICTIILPIVIGGLLNLAKKEYRIIFIHWISIAVFVIFFDYYDFNSFYNLADWPLHLCHMAIYLIIVAVWFNFKQLFYFTYFTNVIGTLFALAFPGGSSVYHLTSPYAVHFWMLHIGIFFIPVVAVKMEIFSRPTLKNLFSQAIIFTVYFMLISAIDVLFPLIKNPIFNGSGRSVDYFFLNGDTISKHIKILEASRRSSITISLNGLSSKLYLLHNLIIYISFITFTFVQINLYNYLFDQKNIFTRIFNIVYGRIKNRKQRLSFKLRKELSTLYNLTPSVIIKHFSKMYHGATKYSVHDFNLEINAGEIFGFIGHNGAGKSTLIKSLVGVNSFDGEISICDIDMRLNPSKVKFLIGYVPDNHPLYERLTGREYIKYVANIYMVSNEDYQRRLDHYLELFNLKNDVDRLINTYSHGMKQKVSIIASLIHDPKIWILDEPLTGLDPTSVLMVKQCIQEHAKKGNIVFFSSHIIEIVEGICDRIAVIKQGQLMLTDTVSNCLKKYDNLTNLYKEYVLSSK